MKFRRIITCDHNRDHDCLDVFEAVERCLPEGYSALIVPEDAHPAAIIPDHMMPDMEVLPESLMMTGPALMMLALSKLCHDDEFINTFIAYTMGSVVEECDDEPDQ